MLAGLAASLRGCSSSLLLFSSSLFCILICIMVMIQMMNNNINNKSNKKKGRREGRRRRMIEMMILK